MNSVYAKNKHYDYNVKVLMIGDSCVGKTSIMMKFNDFNFSPSFITTIGVDHQYKYITYGSNTVKIQLWDTAGQERYRTITNSYLRGANVIIVVYDITNKKSFENVECWLKSIEQNCGYVDIIIVGNKNDLEEKREVSYDEGVKLANERKNKFDFFECSAKKNFHIDEIFEKATQLYIRSYKKNLTTKCCVELEKKKSNNSCCF